jgi:phosphoribosylanthranilate isomerase
VGHRTNVILAGGLTPKNVAKAIHTTQPWGVDSNTGTNLSGDPVTKDWDKIAAFVAAAR